MEGLPLKAEIIVNSTAVQSKFIVPKLTNYTVETQNSVAQSLYGTQQRIGTAMM